jgi:GT2 family glycosyltransferase
VTASVSVVIPNYNYGRYLAGCLQSVLSQDGVDLRVLVIDNVSTDDSVQIASYYAQQDSRLEVRVHERNLGLLASMNEGVDWATGDYFLLLSSDDELTPGALRRAADALDSFPDATFAYGALMWMTGDGPLPPARQRVRRLRRHNGLAWLTEACRRGSSGLASPEGVSRRRLVQEIGGYRPEVTLAPDLELWIRLAARGSVIEIVGADQAYYRFHGKNMSSTLYYDILSGARETQLAIDMGLQAEATRIPNVPALQQLARAALGREALISLRRRIDCGTISDTEVAETLEYVATTAPELRRSSQMRHILLRQRLHLHGSRIGRASDVTLWAAKGTGWGRARWRLHVRPHMIAR